MYPYAKAVSYGRPLCLGQLRCPVSVSNDLKSETLLAKIQLMEMRDICLCVHSATHSLGITDQGFSIAFSLGV